MVVGKMAREERAVNSLFIVLLEVNTQKCDFVVSNERGLFVCRTEVRTRVYEKKQDRVGIHIEVENKVPMGV